MLLYTSGLKAAYYSQAKEDSISMAHLKLLGFMKQCVYDTYIMSKIHIHYKKF